MFRRNSPSTSYTSEKAQNQSNYPSADYQRRKEGLWERRWPGFWQPALSPNPKDCDAQGSFQPAKETKKIPLDPENPERFAVIGANLDSK